MSRSVNLNNVNISIAEFQKLSSGTYNAGEVKLASESKLTKINNHVSSFWRSANKVAVSYEEVMAIKNAFVRALEGGGVDKAEINNVRAQLGLQPDGSADKTLAERSIKPLTRQQIREILDKNAAALNANIGGSRPVVRTSNELYAGVDRAEQARRAGMRADVAVSTAGQRSLDTSSKIALFQDVLVGNIQFITEDEKDEMLNFAVSQRDLVLQNIVKNKGGNPSASDEVMLTCKTDNGNNVKLFAGRSEAEFLTFIDDVIMLLRSPGADMSDAEANTHREFLALAAPKDRLQWLNEAQKDTEDGAFKARTVAVAMLAERGVCDAATLSHVNYLSRDEAFTLAEQLVQAAPDLQGDALRNSDIVINLTNHSKPKKGVPSKEQAFIPNEMTARRYNSNVINGLGLIGLKNNLLPSGFVLMATKVRAEMTQRYGEKAMPPGTDLRRIANYSDYGGIIEKSKERDERATPESIRGAFYHSAVKCTVNNVISNLVKTTLTAVGMDRQDSSMVVGFMKARHPELVDRLMAAQSNADVDTICTEFEATVRDACTACAVICEAQGVAKQRACEALAAKFGVSTEALDKANINFSFLATKATKLASDIANNKVELSTKKEYEDAFAQLADEFVKDRTTRLDAIDKLDMPPDAKDDMKVSLLLLNDVRYVDIAALAAAAKKIDVSGVVSALEKGAPIDQTYMKMKDVASAIRSAVCETLKGHGKISDEAIEESVAILAKLVVGSQPGLHAKLTVFYNKSDVVDRIFPPRDAKQQVEWNHLIFENFSTNLEVYARHKDEEACFEQLITLPRRNAFPPAFTAAFADAGFKGQVVQEAASRAAEEGYHVSELPMLVKACTFYKAATNCSDADAIKAALDPRSTARRLFGYGGRFAESAEQFKKGLALIDKFEAWYAGLHDAIKGGKKDGLSLTLLNFDVTTCTENANRAVEKFLFEEIAVNKKLPLDAENLEDIFGMANNPAMRFIGRGFTSSFTYSLAQIPPEKRQILYEVFDVLMPVPATEAEKNSAKNISQHGILASRVLKNLDALADQKASGTFDRASLIQLLYPDLHLPSNATNKQINDAYETRLMKDPFIVKNPLIMGQVHMTVVASGATLDEAMDAIKENRRLPNAPFMADFNGYLAGLDGTADAGRKTLLGDLLRASPPNWIADNSFAMPSANVHFRFNFADGKQLVAKNGGSTDKSVALANNAIVDKIESLCGKCHPNQLSSICFTLSQSGAGSIVNNAFIQQGIKNDEHMALTFSLAKNDETGAVVVTVSEPEGFPLNFHWTYTIALDGTITSTPMEIEKKV